MCPDWYELGPVPELCHDIRLAGLHGRQVLAQDETYLHWKGEEEKDFFEGGINFCFLQSSEGRDLKVVKIGNGDSNKPAVFIDGGIHAR